MLIRSVQSSMFRGDEAPNDKLNIGQSLFSIAKVYPELPYLIQDSRSLFRITKVYANCQSLFRMAKVVFAAEMRRLTQSLFRITIVHSG